jgi:RHS repeat-associated protein
MQHKKNIFIVAVTVLCAGVSKAQIANEGTGTLINFVRSYEPMVPLTDTSLTAQRPVNEVRTTTAYVDGLGRPLQTVVKQMTPAQKDMVTPIVYDGLGRESIKYLPFASNVVGGAGSANDGKYKANALAQQAAFMQAQFGGQGESHFYSETVFEESPLGRPLKTFAPGASWAGSKGSATERAVRVEYKLNTAADGVRIWSDGNLPGTTGIYAEGSLAKTVTVDEHGHQVAEYKDKVGLVVLKKVQLSETITPQQVGGHGGWLCTYYIYDDFNRLKMVVPPKAVEALATPAPNAAWQLTANMSDELCFAYTYDERGRMVTKKVPGAAAVQMVYDARDRVVMVQDGKQAIAGKWLVTQYDELNRPVRTYLWASTATAAYHRGQAYGSAAYPTAAQLAGAELLSETYYDNYGWVASSGTTLTSTLDATHTANANYYITSYNTAPYFAQPLTANYAVKGMVTGSRTKVLGTTSQYLFSVIFYDERGRAVQTQGINASGGKDVATTQYDFSGKPLRQLVQHQKGTTAVTVLTKMAYDHAGRLLNIKKTVSGTVNGATVNGQEKTVLQNTYNELGQLQKKELGAGGAQALEALEHEYNVRGWLLGINRDYVKDANSTNWFGFELAYDKPANIIPGQSYANPQYNGNISGTTWKARGDAEKRRYDFAYDAVNRLTGADFNQYSAVPGAGPGSFSFSKTAGLDFSVSNLSFDANGNILSMAQKGFKVGGLPAGGTGSGYIDQLAYTYLAGSNKLKQVFDTANDNNSKLGDFKFDPTAKTAIDYVYDVNGNMTVDSNKKISSIQYNHLNLPQTITVTGKGSIEYQYDATGNKLKKIVHENGKPDKVTEYISGLVYEDGQLQFLPHEEGRVRLAKQYYLNGDSAWTWQYDWFLKDHLGNIRTVLTEQKDTARYQATFETANLAKEQALFTNISSTRALIPPAGPNNGDGQGLMDGYPTDNTTVPNQYTSWLDGAGKKLGASLALKVMAGDKVDLGMKYWYKEGWGYPDEPLEPEDVVAALVSSLSGGAAGLSGGKATAAQLSGSGGPVLPGVTAFLNNQAADTSNANAPRAFLNWILLDEQFKYVPSGSGFMQVGAPATVMQTLAQSGLPITKSGYLFVYLSNETEYQNMFFDNLTIQHYHAYGLASTGPLTEETQYYPFGLTMAGISSKAVGRIENKFKYNGKEEQRKEFSDGNGIEWLDYGARMYDAQVGRFFTQDRFAEYYYSINPYQYTANNPFNYIDENGDYITIDKFDDKGNPTLSLLYEDGKAYFQVKGKDGKLTKGAVYDGTDNFLLTAIKDLNDISKTDIGKEFVCDLQGSADRLSISSEKELKANYDQIKHGIITYNQGDLGNHDGVAFNKSYITLGHEIAHAWQDMIGNSKAFNQKYGTTTMAEVFAVRFENYLRANAGEGKMRMKYSDYDLDGSNWLLGWDGKGFKGSSPEYFKKMKMPMRRGESYYPVDANKQVPNANRPDANYQKKVIYRDSRDGKFISNQ